MKKFISILLCLVLTVAVVVPVWAESGEKDYPVILVPGRGVDDLMYDTQGNQILPVQMPEADYFVKAFFESAPKWDHGMVTGDFDPWVEKVMEYFAPVYANAIPDKNGEITDSSGPSYVSGNGNILWDDANYDYCFKYDWRRDPCESADRLNEYIKQIKEANNCDKVSVVGRCYGANVVSAYLYEYGHEDIDTAVYYCSVAKGCGMPSYCFSGKVKIDTETIADFVEHKNLFDDPVMSELLKAFVSWLDSVYAFNLPCTALNALVNKAYPIIAPSVLKASFGAFPSFWAMVSGEQYEKAKEFVFAGCEDEYAGLIEKTDHYHYDIQKNLEDMLAQYKQEGMNLCIISKYNGVFAPIFEHSDIQSDDTVEVSLSSFGAFCADHGKTLDGEYVSGTDNKYISSDCMIDASKCRFPDCTWFIKDNAHGNFPESIDVMINNMCAYDGQMTVDSNPNYPRFIKYDNGNETISPLTDIPQKQAAGFEKITEFFGKFIRLIKALFVLIQNSITK